MPASNAVSASEILDEVVEPNDPTFGREFAQMLLQLKLKNSAQDRIRDLLRRNNAGDLDSAEKSALDNYLLVGQLLDLLQAKARASLTAAS